MEVVKIYVQEIPETIFIGKRYSEADAVNGSFGAKWGEAFATGLFEAIEAVSVKGYFEDSDSYIGLMRHTATGAEYWIGMFAAPGTPVPEGCESIEMPACRLGVGWAYGREAEIYPHEDDVVAAIRQSGIKIKTEGGLLIERYQCPRFTTPDEKGNVILDICVTAE